MDVVIVGGSGIWIVCRGNMWLGVIVGTGKTAYESFPVCDH